MARRPAKQRDGAGATPNGGANVDRGPFNGLRLYVVLYVL